MADEDAPYEVGYGKPPRETRFKAGTSGNPNGRPKGSRNLAAIVINESRKKVRINGSRGSREVTLVQASVMQLANKSAQGDLPALREFIPLVRHAEEDTAPNGARRNFNELDKSVLENLRRRMANLQPSTPDQEKSN